MTIMFIIDPNTPEKIV